jgi:hypothetical protein
MRFRKAIRLCGLLLALSAGRFHASAFLPPTDTVGPLTLSIADPGEVTVLDKPLQIHVPPNSMAVSDLL